MKINEKVRALMEKNHLNQKQLASKAHITEASMSKYLSGERTPRIDVIVNLANSLGTTADDLISENQANVSFSQLHGLLARGLPNLTDEQKKELIHLLREKGNE